MERNAKKMSTCGILKNKNGMIVIYWPSTEPSIKRCTCVNKRKNSGSKWMLENNITRCSGVSSQLETGCRKKCCYGRGKNLGQYSSPSLSPLISHIQQTSPFENKAWENYIFIKKCIRSLLKSSLSVDYVPVYICIRAVVCGYTTI